MATVKTLAGHYNSKMRIVGEKYETADSHAEELVKLGLAEITKEKKEVKMVEVFELPEVKETKKGKK